MSANYEFKKQDFEHPSVLFVVEDMIKCLVGRFLLYGPHYRAFSLKGDETVLDFGCGGGAGSKYLAKLLDNGGNLTCIDTSRLWIMKATKRLKNSSNVRCLEGDIRDSDIPDSFFDVISVINVIHDIAPADRRETVWVLFRKLKAGGRFFIRERIEESHGMEVGDLRTLLSSTGLIELDHKETKSVFVGKYQKKYGK